MKLIRWAKGVFLRMRGRFRFNKAQGMRAVPDRSYFVASDGSVRRKYPRLHMSKKRRLGMRVPAKLNKYVADSRAALEWAGKELKRKDALIVDLRDKFREGKCSYPEMMARLREAMV